MTTMKNLMNDYANYNLWANNRIVEWLKGEPGEKLRQTVPSSFSSLGETLKHIWGTQKYWLSVLTGTEVGQPDEESEDETLEGILKGLIKQSSDFVGYVNMLSEAELSASCLWDTPWVKATLPKFDFIHHCMNHSTYHRGQIITIARNVGITNPPMTDFTAFLVSK